jgi:hypothetical protein
MTDSEKFANKTRMANEEKVSATNGTVEKCKVMIERAEVLLTRDQFSGILAVVW